MVKYKVKPRTTKLPVLKARYDDRSLYDWMNIRTDYIEGIQDEDDTYVWPTYKTLSEKYDTPEKAIQNRAAKERWADHRKVYQNKLALERQKEHAKVLANKAVKFDEDTVNTGTFALELIDQRLHELVELQEVMAENRQILIDKVRIDGEFVTPGQLKASAISGAELESLSKAYALFVETVRKALGIKDGEPAINQVNNIHTVQQINVKEDLLRDDPERVKEMLRIIGNKNFSVPAAIEAAIEEDEDILDGEVVDE